MSREAVEDMFPPPNCAGQVYYKVVARVGPKLISIWDGKTEYQVGVTMRHPPVLMNPKVSAPPGYYLYASAEEALHADIPKTAALFVAPRIILKCLAWEQLPTPPLRSMQGSIIMRYVRPIEVMPLPFGAKNTNFTDSQLLRIKLKHAYDLAPAFVTDEMRNRHPYTTTTEDSRRLSKSIQTMQAHLDKERRGQLESQTLTEGLEKLADQSTLTALRRYVRNHTDDHSVLTPPVDE